MQSIIRRYLTHSIQSIFSKVHRSRPVTIPLEYSRTEKHGDFSTSIALSLSKLLKVAPMVLAQQIVEQLHQMTEQETALFQKIEIASPGFINFFIHPSAWLNCLAPILEQQHQYGASNFGQQKRLLIEFVSSNPTGPLHVGHGRSAAQGDIVARLLKKIGYQVHTEYYINDAGRQMDILALSVWLRYLDKMLPSDFAFPSNAYQGDYIRTIAQSLRQQHSCRFTVAIDSLIQSLPSRDDQETFIDALIVRAKRLLGNSAYHQLLQFCLNATLGDIQQDLNEFDVHFDCWFSEKSLIESGSVNKTIQILIEKGHTYQAEGNLWFRSTTFGDDKDRVLLRANGQPTYFAVDAAYRLHILETRRFETIINLLGADHHGYLARIHAVIKALGYASSHIVFSTLQMVSLSRGDQTLPLSTRSGEFVTLRELRKEVGNDAARLFFVLRKSNQAIDFDLALARSASHHNPVYYLQYAGARIKSIMRQLSAKGLSWSLQDGLRCLHALTLTEEIQLIKQLTQYPGTVQQAGLQYEPALLVQYLQALAKQFHAYYNHTPVLSQKEEVRHGRLLLLQAIHQVLDNGLGLLGIQMPTAM